MNKIILLLVCVIIFITSGCINIKKNSDTNLQDAVYQLEEQNQKLYLELDYLQQELIVKQKELIVKQGEIDRLESLQPRLLSKQIKIKQLELESKQATQQVVRTKAKLRSHQSKAGIVVQLAEVKTELNALAKKTMDKPQQLAMQEAEQLLAMSVDALNSDNDLESAFSLSNKAQKLLAPFIALQTEKQTRLNVDFATPLIMTIKKECNVRNAPGMKSNVLFTMDAGSQVKALAFVKNWLHIETSGQRKGWIYYSLLTLDQ